MNKHLIRLQPLDFRGFYGKSHGIGENTNTPRHWQFPQDSAAPFEAPHIEVSDVPFRHRRATAWTNAPRAAFPSYSFKVKSGGGLKLALPVQGVPIGLNFLQAGSASGSITIADAYVYGLSHAELEEKLRTWSNSPRRLALFKAMRDAAGRPLYVRVVNRVYLTGSVVVSLQSEQSRGGELSGGKSQEVTLLEDGDEGAAKNYLSVLALLNQKVGEALPGGTVTFAQVSSRAVTMNEVFDRPLVIGYLAFDFPILPDGSLGAPVSTLERLKSKDQPEVRLGELSGHQIDYGLLVSAIQSKPAEQQALIYDRAARSIGGLFEREYGSAKSRGQGAERAFSSARRALMREMADGEAIVSGALRTAWIDSLGTP